MGRLGIPVLVTMMAVLACGVQPTASPAPTPPSPSVVVSPVLLHVDFLDTENGWGIAANSAGCVLRTTDGGTTWLNVSPPGASQIDGSSQLFLLDNDHAWLQTPAGTGLSTGTLHRTGDGGLTWTSHPTPFGLADLQFLDSNTGRALAYRQADNGSQAVELFQTSDGGATWTSVFHNDPTQPGSSDSLPLSGIKNGLTFVDASTGWVTGYWPTGGEVYLFVTHDGGASWTQQAIPLTPGYEGNVYETQAPIFFGADGFLPVSVHMPGGVTNRTFYITHDGGATWNGDPENANWSLPTLTGRGEYSFADATTGVDWDGGDNFRYIYEWQNGMPAWGGLRTSLDLRDRLAELDFVSGSTGWALTTVDDAGRSQLYRTDDGGGNWTALIP